MSERWTLSFATAHRFPSGKILMTTTCDCVSCEVGWTENVLMLDGLRRFVSAERCDLLEASIAVPVEGLTVLEFLAGGGWGTSLLTSGR